VPSEICSGRPKLDRPGELIDRIAGELMGRGIDIVEQTLEASMAVS
jgi:hypothetical protein